MKNLLLLLSFFLCLNTLSAQLQIGSMWHYQRFNFFTGNNQWEPITLSLSDSLTIDGKLGYQVDGTCGNDIAPDYLSQENGIMYWHFDTLGWLKLYNFNLEVEERDTCFLAVPPSQSLNPYIAYVVDSVSWAHKLNGDSIKIFHVSYGNYTSGCEWAKFKIYENYGSDECLFPACGLHSGHWRPFLCYEVNGVTEFSPSGEECSIILPAEELVKSLDNKTTLFPNPVDEVLNVQVAEKVSLNYSLNFELYNMTGRLLFSEKMKSGTSTWQFELDNLPSGLYFYEIKNELAFPFNQVRSLRNKVTLNIH